MTPDHPDTPAAYHALKAIQRGSMQALEDKAIAAYITAYERDGKEEAERVYFSFFNKGNNGEQLLCNSEGVRAS